MPRHRKKTNFADHAELSSHRPPPLSSAAQQEVHRLLARWALKYLRRSVPSPGTERKADG
jgi:hypothetical protein